MGGSKDADMSPFECGRRLLDPGSKGMSLDERLNMYFQDADLVPLLVQVTRLLHRSCPLMACCPSEAPTWCTTGSYAAREYAFLLL